MGRVLWETKGRVQPEVPGRVQTEHFQQNKWSHGRKVEWERKRRERKTCFPLEQRHRLHLSPSRAMFLTNTQTLYVNMQSLLSCVKSIRDNGEAARQLREHAAQLPAPVSGGGSRPPVPTSWGSHTPPGLCGTHTHMPRRIYVIRVF